MKKMATDNGPGLRNPKGSASPPYSNGPYEWSEPIAFQKQLLGYDRISLVEHFQHAPGINGDLANATESTRVPVNRDFEVVGTGASSDDVTFSSTTAGLLLTTDGTASQQVIVAPHLDTKQTAWANTKWGTENEVIWEAVVRTGASVASIILWAGLKLTDDQDIATDNNQVFFRFDAGVANWECVYTASSSDSDVEVNSGVVVAVNTNYYFRIEFDSDRKAHFFIDNKEITVSAAIEDDKDLIPYVGVEGNAKTFILVSTAISRKVFE